MPKSPSASPKLAIACGGTGGHFFPGLAIAREFNRLGGQTLLFIAGHHTAEQLAIAQKEGIAGLPVPAITLPASTSGWPRFCIQFPRAISHHLKLLRHHCIDRALVMGSFASAPLGCAALAGRKPLFVHEGNAIMGTSNRLLARWASAVLLSFPRRAGPTPRAPHYVVGMPIRQTMIAAGDRPLTKEERRALGLRLGLSPDRPILLVFGGSQGAQFINHTLVNTLRLYPAGTIPFQLIHLTGQENNDRAVQMYNEWGLLAVVKKFDGEMENLMALADFVICRAGASTIFELAHLGKPALLIPLASARDNHQKENALYWVENQAGLMLEERDSAPTQWQAILDEWIGHPDTFTRYGHHAKRLARPQAGREAASIIFEFQSR